MRTAPMAAKRRRGFPLFVHAPFAGAGVSLYVTAGSSVRYRDARLFSRRWLQQGTFQFGSDLSKTARVASAASPATSVEFDLAAAGLASQNVAINVRYYKDHVENETDGGEQLVTLDAGSNDATGILGTGLLLDTEIRDGGVVRLRFAYRPSLDGVQPATFTAVRTAGPTSPGNVSISYVAGQRDYEIDTPALNDAGNYTYKITAENGATTLDLLTGITFTADASGPAAPTVSATDY
jgi:hypothetical protein